MAKKRIVAQTLIESSKDYIGRDDLIYDIYDIINYKTNNIAIINDDGMGKTSLLNYINLKEIREDENYLDKLSRHNTLIVKTNNPEPKDASDFLVTLIKCLIDELRYNFYIDEDIKMKCGLILETDNNYTNEVEMKTRLYDVFRFLFNENIGVIYLMDDFDKMVNNFRNTNKNAAGDNFSFLRDLANNPSLYKVNYIVTSRVPIEEISYSVDVSGLPGIFTQISMEPLNEKEIEDYACHYFESSKMLILRDEHKMIKQISGGLPSILNFVCFHLFNFKVEGNAISYDKLLEETVDSSSIIFESHWKSCSLNEKVLLKYWAGGPDEDYIQEEAFDEIVRKLIKRKIFNKDVEFVCSAFKTYISSRVKIEENEKEKSNINNDDDDDLIMIQSKEELMLNYLDVLKENITLKDEKINNLIEKIANDEKVKSFQDKITTELEKTNYINYVKDEMSNYFVNTSNNIGELDYFKDKPIAEHWDSLDNSIKTTLMEAEKLYDIYINNGYDQSPVGNPYCTALEALIQNRVFVNVKTFILNKYPNFEFRDTKLKNFKEPMIGEFRVILNEYKKQSEQDIRGNASSDLLLKIYTSGVIKRLKNFNDLRNKISHAKLIETDNVNMHDINKLKRLIFEGKENLFEILIKMSKIKYES